MYPECFFFYVDRMNSVQCVSAFLTGNFLTMFFFFFFLERVACYAILFVQSVNKDIKMFLKNDI